MRKLLWLVLLVPSMLSAQQVVRGQLSTFGDNETNQTFRQTVSVTDVAAYHPFVSADNLLAWDSVGNYNAQTVRIGGRQTLSNWFMGANVGAERLYASTSGDRYVPVAGVTTGFTPTWSNANPIGVQVGARHDAFDEIGQYIRSDIDITTVNGVVDAFIQQQMWVQVVLDYGWLSDDNTRTTVNVTGRYLLLSGPFVGLRYYHRTYAEDMSTVYWSPKLYEQYLAQAGYKFRWDDPTWEGTITGSAGLQSVDQYATTFFGSVVADVARKMTPTLWLTGSGAVSNGNAIAGSPDGYRSWMLAVGVRVAR